MQGKKWILLPAIVLLTVGGCGKGGELTQVEQGMAQIESGAYQESLTNFTAAITKGNELADAYRGEGMAYMGLGEYDKAAASFDQALGELGEKEKTKRQDIYLYKASAQFKSEDYNGVMDSVEQALVISENADAYYMRGAAYLKKDDEGNAKMDFDRASALSPEDYNLFWNIYESYRSKNLSAKGDEYLQKALAVTGESNEDYYQRGRIYYSLENYEKAKEQLAKPVEEKDLNSMLLMGQVYLALEDSQHARSVYQQLLEAQGETPAAYNGLVMCDMADENYDSALSNIQKGLALEDENGKQDLRYNEIVVYERKKDFATAKEKASAFVDLYPTDEAGKKEYDFLSTR